MAKSTFTQSHQSLIGSLTTHREPSVVSDQTTCLGRLTRVFAGHTHEFCRTCFSMGDLGVQVSVHLSVRSSIHQHLPWVSCERNSSYSFVPIFLKLCMCFRHGMRMCMWFGYNCEIIFYHFFHFVNLVIF